MLLLILGLAAVIYGRQNLLSNLMNDEWNFPGGQPRINSITNQSQVCFSSFGGGVPILGYTKGINCTICRLQFHLSLQTRNPVLYELVSDKIYQGFEVHSNDFTFEFQINTFTFQILLSSNQRFEQTSLNISFEANGYFLQGISAKVLYDMNLQNPDPNQYFQFSVTIFGSFLQIIHPESKYSLGISVNEPLEYNWVKIIGDATQDFIKGSIDRRIISQSTELLVTGIQQPYIITLDRPQVYLVTIFGSFNQLLFIWQNKKAGQQLCIEGVFLEKSITFVELSPLPDIIFGMGQIKCQDPQLVHYNLPCFVNIESGIGTFGLASNDRYFPLEQIFGTDKDDRFVTNPIAVNSPISKIIHPGIGNDHVNSTNLNVTVSYSDLQNYYIRIVSSPQNDIISLTKIGVQRNYTDSLVNVKRLILTDYDDFFEYQGDTLTYVDGGGGNNTLSFSKSLQGIVLNIKDPNYSNFTKFIGSNYSDLFLFHVTYPVQVLVTLGNDNFSFFPLSSNYSNRVDTLLLPYLQPGTNISLRLQGVSSYLNFSYQNNEYSQTFSGFTYFVIRTFPCVVSITSQGYYYLTFLHEQLMSPQDAELIIDIDSKYMDQRIQITNGVAQLIIKIFRVFGLTLHFDYKQIYSLNNSVFHLPTCRRNCSVNIIVVEDLVRTNLEIIPYGSQLQNISVIRVGQVISPSTNNIDLFKRLLVFCTSEYLYVSYESPSKMNCQMGKEYSKIIDCSQRCKSCDPTPQICTSCQGETVGRVSNPVDGQCPCLDGYFEIDMVCVQCIKYCQSCKNLESCEKCNEGFQQDLDKIQCTCNPYATIQDNQCIKCPQGCSNCQVIVNAVQCTACVWPSAKPPLCDCVPGQYFYRLQECRDINKKCSDHQEDICLSCAVHRQHPPRCECQQGYFEQLEQCDQCPKPCLGCLAPLSCFLCGHQRTNLPLCDICIDGSFQLTEDCEVCPNKCTTCVFDILDDTINCIVCHEINLTPPQCICPDGMFRKKGEAKCQDCKPKGCLQCLNETFCQLCGQNAILPKCECMPSFFRDNGGYCQACGENCQICTAINTCQICINNTYLLDQRCMSQCRTGYYGKNGICQPCSQQCKTCVKKPNVCLSCFRGEYLQGTNCLDHCEVGYYQDNQLNECKKCDSSCQLCQSSGKQGCKSCSDNYLLYQQMCIQRCITKQINCSICKVDDSTLCFQALDLYADIRQIQTKSFAAALQIRINATTNLEGFQISSYPECIHNILLNCPFQIQLHNMKLYEDYQLKVQILESKQVGITIYLLNLDQTNVSMTLTIKNSNYFIDSNGIALNSSYVDHSYILNITVDEYFHILDPSLKQRMAELLKLSQADTTSGKSYRFLSEYQILTNLLRSSQVMSMFFLLNITHPDEEVNLQLLFLQAQFKLTVKNIVQDKNLIVRSWRMQKETFEIEQYLWVQSYSYVILYGLFITSACLHIIGQMQRSKKNKIRRANTINTTSNIELICVLQANFDELLHPNIQRYAYLLQSLLHNLLEAQLLQVVLMGLGDLENRLALALFIGICAIFIYEWFFSLIVLLKFILSLNVNNKFIFRRSLLKLELEEFLRMKMRYLLDLNVSMMPQLFFHHFSAFRKLLYFATVFILQNGITQLKILLIGHIIHVLLMFLIVPYKSLFKRQAFLLADSLLCYAIVAMIVREQIAERDNYESSLDYQDISKSINLLLQVYISIQIAHTLFVIVTVFTLLFQVTLRIVRNICVSRKIGKQSNEKNSLVLEITFNILQSLFIDQQNITLQDIFILQQTLNEINLFHNLRKIHKPSLEPFPMRLQSRGFIQNNDLQVLKISFTNRHRQSIQHIQLPQYFQVALFSDSQRTFAQLIEPDEYRGQVIDVDFHQIVRIEELVRYYFNSTLLKQFQKCEKEYTENSTNPLRNLRFMFMQYQCTLRKQRDSVVSRDRGRARMDSLISYKQELDQLKKLSKSPQLLRVLVNIKYFLKFKPSETQDACISWKI